MQKLSLHQDKGFWRGSFEAMASPCEVLMEVDDAKLAAQILRAVATEAFRVEKKFSRYRKNNIIFKINHAQGRPIRVDDETARLIDFSVNLYELSDGLFDITSGVLRQAWKFDGSDRVPQADTVNEILRNVGWQKALWQNNRIALQPGMEIDLGGIGKEYAVDRCVQIAQQLTPQSVLINFGGDLACTAPRKEQGYWSVGRLITGRENKMALFQLRQGAIATSGDAHRYLLKDGLRYSHVLNPKTGWPVCGAPHTVSIAAATCIEAGMLSTLAMLQGDRAEEFLKLQEVNFWLN